jgi:ABC-type amino acid transport substrate-binding protein
MLALLITAPMIARSQPATAPAVAADREFVIGTKEAPPFAMKTGDGNWTGISIELWRRIAAQRNWRYRFAEATDIDDLLKRTGDGDFDAAVAAVTVTAQRERYVDFTQPFFATGFGIAVSATGESIWTSVWRAFFSFGFLQAIAVLVATALAVGALIWIVERRHNAGFAGFAKGLGSGVWWSASAMTHQPTTAQNTPATLPGRILAIIWMIASVIAVAVFTAGITTALTKRELQGAVQGVADLRQVRVGAVSNSSGAEYLDRERISHRSFRSANEGLEALQQGRIDAFVHDKPLTAWLVLQSYTSTLRLVDTSFGEQNYAVALPKNSPLRSDLDLALQDQIESDWWRRIVFEYLGKH